MVVPAFGFSVGDFISCAKLVQEIISALKNRGATQYYKAFQWELQTLLNLLDQLRNLSEDSFADESIYNDMCCQAAALQDPLAVFLERITKKYDSGLGTGGSKGWEMRNIKAKWVMKLPEYEKEIRQIIGLRMRLITILFQISHSKTNRRSNEFNRSKLDDLQLAMDGLSEQAQSNSQSLIELSTKLSLPIAREPTRNPQDWDEVKVTLSEIKRLVEPQIHSADDTTTNREGKSASCELHHSSYNGELCSGRGVFVDPATITFSSSFNRPKSSAVSRDESQEYLGRGSEAIRSGEYYTKGVSSSAVPLLLREDHENSWNKNDEATANATKLFRQDGSCCVCQGDQERCDCSLRRLMWWNRRIEESIKPAYARNGELLIELYEKLCNGGWARAPDPVSIGKLIYVDMLASQSERMHFRKPPILEKDRLRKPLLRGWRRVENAFGRIYYEHSPSGLGMYQHPSESNLVDQNTGHPLLFYLVEREKCALLDGKWIIDDPDAQCQLSYLTFSKIQEHDAFGLLKEYVHGFDLEHIPDVSLRIPCCSTHKSVESLCIEENMRKYLEEWEYGMFSNARGSDRECGPWMMGSWKREDDLLDGITTHGVEAAPATGLCDMQ